MSLQEQILLMRANLDSAEQQIKSLEAGRKSSSAKARASLMKLKTQSHDLRKSVITKQKELPVKSRAKKVVEPTINAPTAAAVEAEEPTVPAPETQVKKPRKPRVKKEKKSKVD